MKRNSSKLPWYAYSSYNKRGGQTHPRVRTIRNRVLDLWAEMADYQTIAEELDISITTVVMCILRGKRLKDPRVVRPYRHKKIQQAEKRRREIRNMARDGLQPREIAKRLGCTKRLVLIRLKEMESA